METARAPTFWSTVFSQRLHHFARRGSRQVRDTAQSSTQLGWEHLLGEATSSLSSSASLGPADTGAVDLGNATARCFACQLMVLNEYRTRLIADVVTGKLDVREAAAALPRSSIRSLITEDTPKRIRRPIAARVRDQAPAPSPPMTTDLTERGLERLICKALTGDPCDPPSGRTVGEPSQHLRRRRLVPRQPSRLQPRVLRRPRPTPHLPAHHPAQLRPRPPPRRGLPHPPQVPRPPPGRDRQARHHRRPPQRHQARPPRPRPLLRHTFRPQRDRPAALPPEPVQRHPPTPLQPGRRSALAGHRALHQRAPRLHVRAQEQPYQADLQRRHPAVQAGPQPARAPLPVRALRGTLRGRRERGPLLHAPPREGVVVPALQPGLAARGRQSAQPGRSPVRVPVARRPHPGERVQHPGELRAGGGVEEREDGQEQAGPDLAEVPAARRGAPAPGGRPRARGGEAVPDPALGRQRQELFDRLAGPSAHPAGEGWHARL